MKIASKTLFCRTKQLILEFLFSIHYIGTFIVYFSPHCISTEIFQNSGSLTIKRISCCRGSNPQSRGNQGDRYITPTAWAIRFSSLLSERCCGRMKNGSILRRNQQPKKQKKHPSLDQISSTSKVRLEKQKLFYCLIKLFLLLTCCKVRSNGVLRSNENKTLEGSAYLTWPDGFKWGAFGLKQQ